MFTAILFSIAPVTLLFNKPIYGIFILIYALTYMVAIYIDKKL